MSYNGSGTFVINTTGQPVVTGTPISSTVFNALTADLATGLSTAITKDGQTATTARIPFAAGINSTLVTDSTSTTTGSIITAGGAGVAKALFVGTTANVAGAVTLQSTLGVTGITTFSAQPIFSSLTASSAVATDASKGLVSVTNTGTGNNVLATSPTLVTPVLGAASATSVTVAAGAVGTPSITTAGDTNTGIFFPAADTIGFSEGGVERARIDSSGNLGLGVIPSPWNTFTASFQIDGASLSGLGANNTALASNAYYQSAWKYYGTGSASLYQQNAGQHAWSVAGSGTAGNAITFTQAMTLDASGNVGIGTSSPTAKLHVYASAGDINGQIETAGAGQAALNLYNSTRKFRLIADASANALTIYDQTASAERARIDSSGNLLVGTTSVIASAILTVVSSAANNIAYIRNSNASPYGLRVNYSTATPNNTDNWFYYADDATAQRFQVRSNGGIANYSANDVNLSDRREKTNFAPAKSYLDVICAIPVQTFNYVDQNLEEDGGLTLGVVAQDVQAVAPELVMESNWAAKDEDPKMRLSIYQTDLQYALMKCIQEQQALITALTTRITALESN